VCVLLGFALLVDKQVNKNKQRKKETSIFAFFVWVLAANFLSG
jgi:hypothetical protein